MKDPKPQAGKTPGKDHLNTQLDELDFLREKDNMTLEEYESNRRQILGEQ